MTLVDVTTPALGAEVERQVPEAVRIVLAAQRVPHKVAAEHLHLHPTRFSERMRGKSRFSVAELVDLAGMTGAPVEAFLDRSALAAWVQKRKILNGGAAPHLTIVPGGAPQHGQGQLPLGRPSLQLV